jgi:hypothetical protein
VRCPDWQRLVAHRNRRGAPEPPGWHAALDHLASCVACQKSAPRADESLLFRRLPAIEVGDDEIAAMQVRVHNMRRVAPVLPAARPSWRGTRRLAAAAALTLLGLSLESGSSFPPSVRDPAGEAASASTDPLSTELSAQMVELAGLAPTVEVLDGNARVYQVAPMDEVYALVMIVDSSLDSGFDGGP